MPENRPDQPWMDLLRRTRAGDAVAKDMLFRALRKSVHRWVNHYVLPRGDRWDNSDLTQVVIAAAWRDMQRFRGSTDSELRSWLKQLLRRSYWNQMRELYAAIRDQRREEPLPTHDADSNGIPMAPAATFDAHVISAEALAALQFALALLPDHYRLVLQLRTEGQPFAAIGRQLGRSAAAARQIWLRALEQLREQIQWGGGIPLRHNSNQFDLAKQSA